MFNQTYLLGRLIDFLFDTSSFANWMFCVLIEISVFHPKNGENRTRKLGQEGFDDVNISNGFSKNSSEMGEKWMNLRTLN